MPSINRNAVKLPTKLNVPPDKLTGYTLCIFGAKGIGKSSLACQFPNPLLFMWEPGRRNLKAKQIPDPSRKEKPLDWERFREYLGLVAQDSKVQTVIIDTIDRCYDACLVSVCRDAGFTHPSEPNDYGKTWREVIDEFQTTMDWIREQGKTLVYTSHQRLRENDGWEQMIPTCPGQAFEFMKATVDIVLYYNYYGGQRCITVRGDENVWSACAADDYFLTPKGDQLRSFFVPDTNAADAYKTLNKAFNNREDEAEFPDDEED